MTKRSIGPAGASIVSDDGKRIKELTGRLRKMSNDSKFTNEDREEVLKELKKLDLGKLDLGKILGRIPGESVVKPRTGPDLTKRAKGGMINKYAKGGEVKGYMDGGEVEVAMDDSPSSGMITQRGWGASRKT